MARKTASSLTPPFWLSDTDFPALVFLFKEPLSRHPVCAGINAIREIVVAQQITRAKAVQCLWDVLDTQKVGMLGLCHSDRHMQPMTAYAERDGNILWFFTYNDTKLARDIAAQGQVPVAAMYCIDSGDRDLYGCLGGTVSLQRDMMRVEKFWNTNIAAWFPEGKADPRLTLIRFELHDADLWVSYKGALGYLAEIAKANIVHVTPDLGRKVSVRF